MPPINDFVLKYAKNTQAIIVNFKHLHQQYSQTQPTRILDASAFGTCLGQLVPQPFTNWQQPQDCVEFIETTLNELRKIETSVNLYLNKSNYNQYEFNEFIDTAKNQLLDIHDKTIIGSTFESLIIQTIKCSGCNGYYCQNKATIYNAMVCRVPVINVKNRLKYYFTNLNDENIDANQINLSDKCVIDNIWKNVRDAILHKRFGALNVNEKEWHNLFEINDQLFEMYAIKTLNRQNYGVWNLIDCWQVSIYEVISAPNYYVGVLFQEFDKSLLNQNLNQSRNVQMIFGIEQTHNDIEKSQFARVPIMLKIDNMNKINEYVQRSNLNRFQQVRWSENNFKILIKRKHDNIYKESTWPLFENITIDANSIIQIILILMTQNGAVEPQNVCFHWRILQSINCIISVCYIGYNIEDQHGFK